jgi:hypothetical protein
MFRKYIGRRFTAAATGIKGGRRLESVTTRSTSIRHHLVRTRLRSFLLWVAIALHPCLNYLYILFNPLHGTLHFLYSTATTNTDFLSVCVTIALYTNLLCYYSAPVALHSKDSNYLPKVDTPHANT